MEKIDYDIDKNYVLGIIKRIEDWKKGENRVPSYALFGEMLADIRLDVQNCVRALCLDGKVSFNKTLNSLAFHVNDEAE